MTQLAFDFDEDINGPCVLDKVLHDPCQRCHERESEYTIPHSNDDGICNSCAEDREMDWAERYLDRD